MNPSLYQLLSEYPLEALLQTIPTGLFLVDLHKTIIYWNAEATRITGFTAEEVVGKHCSILCGESCHTDCDIFSSSTPKPDIGLSCSFQHKDGRTVSLTKNVDLLRDKGGQVVGGIEAFIDTSRLKKLEHSLRAAVEERTQQLELEKSGLRAVLDGMVDPAYICDPSYRISFANRAMLNIIGEIGEKYCYQAIYKRESVCLDCPLPQVLKGREVLQEKALGEPGRTYEIINTPYPTRENPTHKLGVSRDITERLEYRRRLQQTNRELDAFVSTVSHDLRSPLTPLIGFAELLDERYGEQLDDIGQDCIFEIRKTAEKMKDLLEDLLSLSQVGKMNIPTSPIDATSIAADVQLELADIVLETGAKITIAPLPSVTIAASLLTNLFRNLLINALKYAVHQNPCIEISGKKYRDRVRYKVIDHGLGIAPEEREKIFEPFKRGIHSKGIPGTGIGLATVAKIARVSGGNAWVEETPGGGATFIVDFPLVEKSNC
ncbi:PAS domain S-box-containing protein [Desulfuromusa kysingii]|uniref:histidine kinase n=1 Tax=Desulfuromusa kysingii TaxID=37625 RepID=A0A1H4CJ73_9BACT|nr:PAS domain-containing sensor histidine kinase [Desulfuromusa kysingii]SEA60481.1 PAS domain S-box-containing protein [Desulfuromusa kysingii]